MVVNFDARTMPSDMYQPSPARFTIAAHDGAACALDVNPHIRGCLATAGTDKMVKIWNVQGEGDDSGGKRQVSLVAGRDLGLVGGSFAFAVSTYGRDVLTVSVVQGEVFSAVWSPDDPLTLAAAGSKAKMQIWDVGANFGARKVFGTRLAEAGRTLSEKKSGGVIGIADDEEDDDNSDDDD
jgi:periodic tryptophan protein 1